MNRYADKMCQVVGCKMLSALCTTIRTRSDALDNGAVGAVLYAMSHFGEDEEFYIPAFEALTQLLSDDPSAQENFIKEVKNSRKKYRMVVEIMEKHAKSAFEGHREILVQQGVVLGILRALQNCKDCAVVQKNGLTALALLAEALENNLHDMQVGLVASNGKNDLRIFVVSPVQDFGPPQLRCQGFENPSSHPELPEGGACTYLIQ
ncbi:hypothetical protein OS493_012059 [Desmophyllum pertusum]|uniref:Uncharacterized protein n=1 Tax=Desmophyllum pertusum TaxID=174260 RepID=A0A9X0D9L0_9CNID|nr:hypothetical protein OS493_012059 [Desmophyllum pertusum]